MGKIVRVWGQRESKFKCTENLGKIFSNQENPISILKGAQLAVDHVSDRITMRQFCRESPQQRMHAWSGYVWGSNVSGVQVMQIFTTHTLSSGTTEALRLLWFLHIEHTSEQTCGTLRRWSTMQSQHSTAITI